MSAIARPALALACLLSVAAGAMDDTAGGAPAIPSNIRVDPALTHIVDDMLLHSSIFRDQCARLQAVAHLRILLTVDLKGAGHRTSCRADSVMKRFEFGFIDVAVRLRSLSQASELIAHEFEHVLEYVEGVDHREASRRDRQEVWMVGDSRFETARAIDAGRRVAAEVARSRSAQASDQR